jgi:hypothetical protein
MEQISMKVCKLEFQLELDTNKGHYQHEALLLSWAQLVNYLLERKMLQTEVVEKKMKAQSMSTALFLYII